MMSRRDYLKAMAGSVSALAVADLEGAPVVRQTNLGIAITSYHLRADLAATANTSRFKDAGVFLDYCHQLGAAGIQTSLGSDSDQAAVIRRNAESWGMYVEGQIA